MIALASVHAAVKHGVFPMKFRLSSLLVGALLALGPIVAAVPTEAPLERLDASFLLALGRLPSDAEKPAWASATPVTVADLLSRHRASLRDDAAAQRAVYVRSWRDAFGCAPDTSDLAAAPATSSTYAEWLQRHLQWLTAHPADYRQVVDRAYQRSVGRGAFPIEQDYWQARPTLSFALLVGCIDNWARRNAPGLMATTGMAAVSVNCRYLTTRRLSPAVAAEVRAATGLVPAGTPARATAGTRTVVAPGAAELASIGGIHFAAAGRE